VVAGATRVSEIEVVRVVDTVGVLGTYDRLFPAVAPEAWAPWRERHPELFDGDCWVLPFGAFLLRPPTTTVLIDAGVGPVGSGTWLPEREGRLLAELERIGVRPDDVDVVFNTHIDVDHVGWNQVFDKARLVLHRAAWAAAEARADREHVSRSLLALADRVEPLDGEAALAPGVVAFETPGHATGHMGVRVGDELVLLGDAAPHPAQLTHPDWLFRYDDDPPLAARTRREVLAAYGDRMLACGHFPGSGVGRLLDAVWTPVELSPVR
jgi:glyoxylase-like metal-dependent hydrolase (beta-lactamase superfamily II)